MPTESERIVCRKCDNEFAVADENCPKCGTAVRGYKGPGLAILAGVPMIAASLLKFEVLFFFGLIGLVLVVLGAHFIRDRRDRLVQPDGSQ